MTRVRNGAIVQPLQGLFESGTIGGLSDAELLARFAARDEAKAELAFEALIRRHGPMVLRVCERELADWHDAQDAFQATFLVLARKARTIRSGESLPSWLRRVALCVTWRARKETRRRWIVDRVGAELIQAKAEPSRSTEHAELHDELGRLPEKYRLPLVLCYFEGLTHEEAARRLSWPVGTVRSRMARGREALRDRMTARGLALPAALLAGAFGGKANAGTLSMALADSTVRAVLSPSSASTRALTLMKGALMISTRIRLAKAAVLGLSLGFLAATAIRASSPAKPAQATPAPAARTFPNDPAQLQGTWVRISTETAGRLWKYNEKDPPLRLVIRGDVFDFGGNGTHRESAAFFPHAAPSKLALTPLDKVAGPAQGKPYFGIYKVDDDTLTLCLRIDSSGIAPTEFATKPDDHLVIDVYRREPREAPAKAKPASLTDLDRLQGTWYRVASHAGGKNWMVEGMDPKHPALAVVFQGDKWFGLKADGTLTDPNHTVILTPDANPKRMLLADPSNPQNKGLPAIYKIEGETLTLCIEFDRDKPYPTEFSSTPGNRYVLDVYRRLKP